MHDLYTCVAARTGAAG